MQNFDLNLDHDLHFTTNNTQDSYYHQNCRLYLANLALTNKLKQLNIENKHYMERLRRYEDEDWSCNDKSQKGKRIRRNADEIHRFYKCVDRSCGKSYGSQGSLNQHYKLKHPQVYKKLPNIQTLEDEGKQNQNQNVVKEEYQEKDLKKRNCSSKYR